MTARRVTVMGATGSIGRSALDVVARHPDRFTVAGLAANTGGAAFLAQVCAFRPRQVALADPAAARRLRQELADPTIQVLEGPEGLCALAAAPADVVVAAIVGGAGLASTFAAVAAGNPVALANKESLVMAGALLMGEAARRGVPITPVDSEHSAIHQCLAGSRRADLDHIVLTASGGPFRTTPRAALAAVTPEQAARHPNWNMGAKITVDSATLMNKGLEVIEARWLFELAPEQIRVVVHPQSIVHSMVAFRDGSVMAQMGLPDMRVPLAWAMSGPERIPLGVAIPDFAKLGALTFEEPDTGRFPCLSLAYAALRAGGTAPCVLNAANEVAVAAFLADRIGFMDIPRLVEEALVAHGTTPLDSLDGLLATDARVRAATQVAVTRAAAHQR